MATYALGDIQGCFSDLQRLLTHLRFDPAEDRLWFLGDLVNRGPDSLAVLRWVAGLGERAITLLGNHDLHLLALWQGGSRHFKPNPQLAPIFAAPDGERLLEWLRHRPLLHRDRTLGYTLVHAGLPPQWSIEEAEQYAREVEQLLQSDQFPTLMAHLHGNQPDGWSDSLSGWDRARFIINAFTRLRFCSAEGRLDFSQKIGLQSQHPLLQPWFTVPNRRSRSERILFGHWSTLNLYRNHRVYGIDTGCLWGGRLTAMRLDGELPEFISLQCGGEAAPEGID